jgi:uncharacterized ferritin-like protein (DUF455 family)
MNTLRHQALAVLTTADPRAKAALARALDESAGIGADAVLAEPPGLPARPARPALVPHTQVPQRSIRSPDGPALLVHAIAHIELNAIDLACDVVWRFPGQPEAFYRDWAQVAREEALHFTLLADHLVQRYQHAYGDFPAHNTLWDMAERTKGDVLARVALVPRLLEARGLDASPAVREKLAGIGDADGAAIIDLILRDEIGHVAFGNRWFGWLCAQRGLDMAEEWPRLVAAYDAPHPRPPFNVDARRRAGFTDEELAGLARGPLRT